MDPDLARWRLADARVGRLATADADGRPHLVPCCFVLESSTVYSAVDGKQKAGGTLRRVANVRANPVASLLVDHYDEDWSTLWWVRVDGIARVVDDPVEEAGALDRLRAKYEQYDRVALPGPVLGLDVTRWRSWP
jgi:PPOX class probable F420-dependent enzyme